MHSSTILTLASTLALASAAGPTGALGDAAVVQKNPAGVTYTATLPNSPSSGVRGYVSGTSNANGTGVLFNVNLSGFPDASLGPFLYHIHDQPVPANGNCTGTLAHLDPYIRGEKPPCDPTMPQTCQVGDLAGKHGKIMMSPFTASFLDLYLSTASGPASFFGNRSIVIHTANATRLTCANFTLSSGKASNSSTNSTTGGSGTTTTGGSATPSPFKGGAVANGVSAGMAVLVGFAVLAVL